MVDDTSGARALAFAGDMNKLNLATVSLVFASFLSCGVPEPERCVPGFRDGMYAVDLMERYGPNGTFAFDQTLLTGTGDSVPNCQERESFEAGERVVFRVQGTESNRSKTCNYHNAEVIDPRAESNRESNRTRGRHHTLFAGRNFMRFVPACREEMVATTYVTAPGTDPFATPVAGQVPPVLMGFTLLGDRSTLAGNPQCPSCYEFWVVKVTRVGDVE